jgi:hypothetical protein
MAQIKKSDNNELLPKTFITSLSVDNTTISVGILVEPRTTNLDRYFTDSEYLKYLQVGIRLEGVPILLIGVDQLPLNIEKTIAVNTQQALNLAVLIGFDINSFARDNRLTDPQKNLLLNTYGSVNEFIYPLLNEEGELITQLIDVNGQSVSTIAADVRAITFFENLDLEYQTIEKENDIYFDIIGSSYDQNKINNFINFDYGKFINNNSYFKQENYRDFNIQINITNDNILLDTIDIVYQSSTEVRFISKNKISTLIKQENKLIYFHFSDQYDNNSTYINKNYNFQVVYVDKSYTNFYNPYGSTGYFIDVLNNYMQLKNVIDVANRFSSYNVNPPDTDPLYLNLNNNKFTSLFLDFYANRIEYYKQFNINIIISTLMLDIITIINKFLSTKLDVEEEAIKLTNALNLSNCKITTYYEFFKVCDRIFNKIQYILSQYGTPTIFYTKNYKFSTSISNAFYSIGGYKNTTIPTIGLSNFKQFLNFEITTLKMPKLFYYYGEEFIIDTTLDFNTELYNYILEYVDSKNGDRQPIRVPETTSDNFFQKYGTTYDVLDTAKSTQTNLLLQSKKNTLFSNVTNPTYLTSVPPQRLKIRDIKDLNKDEKTTITDTNKLLLSLLTGETIDKPTMQFITPKLSFSYYDYAVEGNWIIIDNNTNILPNMLIKMLITDISNTIFSLNRIPQEKIDLISNYFIIGKD